MSDPFQSQLIEPHAAMLHLPPNDQLLFKIVKVEHLLHSIKTGYLRFNRIDRYEGFKDADPNDGAQLPADRPGNSVPRFAKAPTVTAADYYDRARERIYAYCMSLENSEFIWKQYAGNNKHGKICIVFEFGKLRALINEIMRTDQSQLIYGGLLCKPIFAVDYGIVEYVDWGSARANAPNLPAGLKYAYMKDRARYAEEAELRITLSANGIPQAFILDDGSPIDFPPTLNLDFDFKRAVAIGAIRRIEIGADTDPDFLRREFERLQFTTKGDPLVAAVDQSEA